MKRLLLAAILCFVFSANILAQQTGANAPATKEDVERYLEATHSHELMIQTMEAMSKPMHRMVHDRVMKDKDKLPADFETRMNKMMDDMLKNLPLDEMIQAMVPAYQKHFTKGDMDSLVAFYTSPAGQKILREMPAITAESMDSMMTILNKQMAAVQQRVDQEFSAMLKESEKKPGQKPPATQN